MKEKNENSTSFTSHPGGNLVDGLPPAASLLNFLLPHSFDFEFRRPDIYLAVM